MRYRLGPVKPWVRDAAQEVGARFHIRTVYGFDVRNIAGTSVLSDHALGLADDFMCDIPTGNALAAYVQANAARLGVTYIIHNRRIWSVARASEGWRPYTGVNPHTDHVHVSFQATGPGKAAASGDPVVGGASTAGFVNASAIPGADAFKVLTSGATWIRVSMFASGLVLILIALVGMGKAQSVAAHAVLLRK